MKDFPTTEVCPRDDIAAYVDGELSAEACTLLEAHIGDCGTCRRELRQQRQLLAALSASLGNEEVVELPDDFARTIAANAESSVSGLRRPGELFITVFICALLSLVAILSIGSELPVAASAVSGAGEKMLAFGSHFVKFSLNAACAVSVVARTLGSHLAGNGPIAGLALAGSVVFVGSSVWVIRRRNA